MRAGRGGVGRLRSAFRLLCAADTHAAVARGERPIASVKVVEFAWVGEATISGQAALGGRKVGVSSVGGISISAMASTCM